MAASLGLVVLGYLLLVSSTSGSLLQNVTESVFGTRLGLLPLAFGDFNADKLTDIFVLDVKERSRVSVLLASSQNTFIESGRYFEVAEKRKGLFCYLNEFEVVAASPADFDGDGGMDLLIVAKKDEDLDFTGFVLWGEHKQGKSDKLICTEPSLKKGTHNEIRMSGQPLIVDGNGDAIADIFGRASDGAWGIWIFNEHRSYPEFVKLTEASAPEFRNPHSNAFVDLNSDGNADIFVTTEGNFELWKDVGHKSEKHFELHKKVPVPQCDASKNGSPCIGQSVFADFDLDGRMDMIFPACLDGGCQTSTLFYSPVEDLWNAPEENSVFLTIPLDLQDRFQFQPTDMEKDFYPGMSPHVGDINLDGYPDLLLRLQNKLTKKTQMHLLLNVYDSDSPSNRSFLIQPEVMRGINETSLATFYDLYEDGTNDIILVQDEGNGRHRVGAFTNATQDSDAYFVKVIVLSGICYKDCVNDSIQVPYGTNLPGQTICYSTQRQLGEHFADVKACAPQLTQTAHHALQLPYTIFGLGLAPNFIDYMYVNVTNASAKSHRKTWPQIIPNSQLYVIPHPTNDPSQWEAKLFITPSRSIMFTALALLGTCVVISVVAVLLHIRERRLDRREMLQTAQRFHFDAM